MPQTEWEIVDEPSPRERSRAKVLQAMLGRWWQWKLAGLMVAALALAMMLALLAGTIILLGASLAALIWAAGKLRRLLVTRRASGRDRTGLVAWHPTDSGTGRRGFVSKC